MSFEILLKRSSASGAAPSTGDVSTGELALNTFDGKLYTKKEDGTVVTIATAGGSAPVDSVFGRTGTISAQTSDYDASQVDNDSNVAGTYVSNALNSLDSNKIGSVSEDSSPSLGGDLDSQNQDLDNARTLTFNSEFDNGNSGSALTVPWASGQKQKITLTDNATISFNDPPGPCNLMLKLVQDPSGGRSVTWPSSGMKWAGGSAPTLSSSGNFTDLTSFYFDGVDYYGQAATNFS